MSKKNKRQTVVGKVVSSKMDKTVTVLVTRLISHPIYKKRVKRYKKYFAHIASVEPKDGDIVKLVSIRPLSKNKTWQVSQIIQESKILD